ADDGDGWRQVGGPPWPSVRLQEVLGRLGDVPSGRRWGLAPARVGPVVDVVADGSALRVHALREGRLVRTVEVLSFLHAADRSTSLGQAAAAYQRLAAAAGAMAAAGGRLVGTEDGLLHVGYDA
ncbi:hypothetical protein, partial [Aquipuribacter hungaricus]